MSEAPAVLDQWHSYRALRRSLARLRLRVRMLLAVRLLSTGGAVGGGAAAVIVLVLRLWGIWYPPLLPAAVLGLVAGAAIAAALVWRLPDQAIAAGTDRRLELKDRLTSAVCLCRLPEQSGMAQAMVSDALRHAASLRAPEAYPLRAYPATKATVVCLLALLAVQMLPIPPLMLSAREREDRALLKKHAQQIEPVAKQLKKEAKENKDAEAEKLARRLERLARQLKRGQLHKKEALLSLREAEQELVKLEQRAAPPALKTASQASEELARASGQRIAKKAEQLARQATKMGAKKKGKELAELAKRAKQATTPKQAGELARELEQRATELGKDLKVPADLSASLASALANQDWQAMMEELAALAMALGTEGRELTEEELNELAEQLEELAEQLTDAELEELRECLKKSAECLRKGDYKGACKAVVGACQQAGKQAGRARLARVARAGAQCLGQCAGGRCQIAGQGAAGRGGPARQDAIPPNAEAAKLYAPRPTQNAGDPTRVPAQVRPTGEMRAIEEKGAPTAVADSRVPYYEVMGEYSRAAEEALTRDEVPPAYRSTIRDYFEALQPGGTESEGEAEGEGKSEAEGD